VSSTPETQLPRTGGRRLRPAFLCIALLPLGFGAQWLAARSPGTTEALYSTGVFPALRRVLTAGVSRSPGSVVEVLILALGLYLALRLILGLRALRKGAPLLAVIGSGLLRIGAIGGVLYALFLLFWGFNYAREPYALRIGYELRESSSQELVDLAESLIGEANALRASLDEDEFGVVDSGGDRNALFGRVRDAYRLAAAAHPELDGPEPVLRVTRLSRLLTIAGIAGIYSPFTAEPHVNGGLPDSVMPFIACHEVAHSRGFAREDEANFIAFLVCRESGDPLLEYSATRAAMRFVLAAVGKSEPIVALGLIERISEAVERDSESLRAFWELGEDAPLFVRAVREHGDSVNDAYLKTQGEKDGTASYGRMVDLVLAWQRER
jgi:hypothetical protein